MNILRYNKLAFESLFSLSQVDILFLRCLHTTAVSNINIRLNNIFLTKPLFGDFFVLKAQEEISASKS